MLLETHSGIERKKNEHNTQWRQHSDEPNINGKYRVLIMICYILLVIYLGTKTKSWISTTHEKIL